MSDHMLNAETMNINSKNEKEMEIAESLWNRYLEFGIDYKDKNILDFGCASGHLCRHALKQGVKTADGVDIYPHWKKLSDESLTKLSGLTLYQSEDIANIPEIQSKKYDFILSSGTLFLLNSEYLEKVLSWFYEHLNPGGVALLRTRCFSSKGFNDLSSTFSFYGSQFLFSRRILEKYINNQDPKRVRNHICYTKATWLMCISGAGFKIEDLKTSSDYDYWKYLVDHREKLSLIHPSELGLGEILVYAKKPEANPELPPFKAKNTESK